MRDINRIKPFLDKFEELWSSHEHVDFRFGQLIEILYRKSNHIELFSIEDDVMLKIIEKAIKEGL